MTTVITVTTHGLTVQSVQAYMNTYTNNLDEQFDFGEDSIGEIRQAFSQFSFQLFWELEHITKDNWLMVMKEVIRPEIEAVVGSFEWHDSEWLHVQLLCMFEVWVSELIKTPITTMYSL